MILPESITSRYCVRGYRSWTGTRLPWYDFPLDLSLIHGRHAENLVPRGPARDAGLPGRPRSPTSLGVKGLAIVPRSAPADVTIPVRVPNERGQWSPGPGGNRPVTRRSPCHRA